MNRTPGVPDAGLQAERTALAWRRLGAALLITVVTAGRLGLDRWPVAAAVLVALGVPLAAAVLHGSDRRYRRGSAALRGTRPMPDGRLPLAAAAAVALLGAAGAWIVAAR